MPPLSPLRLLAIFSAASLLSFAPGAWAYPTSDQLALTSPGTPPSGPQVRIAQPLGRKGPTSIRYYGPDVTRNTQTTPNPNDPFGATFYTRDRDLGQTFTVPAEGKAFRLDAITLRVGPVAVGSLTDALGAPVFVQLFEVGGTAVIHDYGTTGTEQVSGGYTNPATRSMADDYITGEHYTPLLVATGALLPTAITLGQGNTAAPTSSSAGSLLRFDLTATGAPILHPGRRYAFMVGFVNHAPAMSIPLDNWDYLNQTSPAPTPAQLHSGPYAGGHAIRREGRIPDPHLNLSLVFSTDPIHSVFDPATRFTQQPTTFGRPDVDTYRDLTFWIEGSDVTDFQAWADQQGVQATNPFADANNDGSPDALGYFFGTGLHTSPTPWISLATTPEGLAFFQFRNTATTGLLAEFEWSQDLQQWHADGTTNAGLRVDFQEATPAQPPDLPPGTSLKHFTAHPTPAAFERLFLRMRLRTDAPTIEAETWTTGTTRSLTAGTQRLLLLVAAQESTATSLSVQSATYGGRPMTLIAQDTASDVNGSDCVAAFYLPEAELALASGSAFSVVWRGAGKGPAYASTLLRGVDQTQPLIASARINRPAQAASTPLATESLPLRRHDLSFLAAIHGSGGTLSALNAHASVAAFTPSGGVALVAQKFSLVPPETPAVSHTAAGRLALIGWTLATANP
jgi:hypothetical protein